MQVLAGSQPWDLVCRKRRTLYRVKKSEVIDEVDLISENEQRDLSVKEVERLCEERVNEEWQRSWDRCEKGRVTYEFIKDVTLMSRCRKLDFGLKVGFILTGHGSLNAWLNERRLSDSASCRCGAEREDWVHLLCECELYDGFRNLDRMGVKVRAVNGRREYDEKMEMSEEFKEMNGMGRFWNDEDEKGGVTRRGVLAPSGLAVPRNRAGSPGAGETSPQTWKRPFGVSNADRALNGTAGSGSPHGGKTLWP
uniref:Reverse transcriptase n=2 Tax=Trichogramma kaykai TaxID=54128 RepID=A0ABD2X852_9HYME